MTHMLKLSLMCATNDGGFLQLMSHGKITVFTASMQAKQFQNIVPDAVMQLDGSPFCVHDIEKNRIQRLTIPKNGV